MYALNELTDPRKVASIQTKVYYCVQPKMKEGVEGPNADTVRRCGVVYGHPSSIDLLNK
jgi:hypothetical protein